MAKTMQTINLASYALIAAIGVSALVTSFSDKADADMVTYGTVKRYKDVKAVTNLVSYGPVNQSMIATTVYNNADNAVYTVHVNLANCIKASK